MTIIISPSLSKVPRKSTANIHQLIEIYSNDMQQQLDHGGRTNAAFDPFNIHLSYQRPVLINVKCYYIAENVY